MKTIKFYSEKGVFEVTPIKPIEVTPIKSKGIYKVVTDGCLYHTYELSKDDFHDLEYNTKADWEYMIWHDELQFIQNNPTYEVKVRIDGKNTKTVWLQAPSKRWLKEYGEPWGRKIIKIY